MDPDVLELVSAQALSALVCQPAVVNDHQRRIVLGETFPVLVKAPGESVIGLLVRGLTDEALKRAQFFEGEEYVLKPITVMTMPDSHAPALDSKVCEAVFFADNQVYQVQEENWRLQTWQCQAKAEFMPRLRHYMSYFGKLSAAEADVYW